MLFEGVALDLPLTLMDSGQCFRWTRKGDRYGCVLDGRAVWLWNGDDGLHVDGDTDPGFLRHYLDLDRDYAAIAREYAQFPAARAAIERYPGLRVLNQPAWEALICFMLSANNNVARIRGLTDALCRTYGDDRGGLYSFPTPERLADVRDEALRALKVGYRAPYLIGAARAVLDGFPLESLHALPYDAAHALLLTLPGVGDKVADCVLLFGCGHASAFPVDVWMERVLREWFAMTCRSRAALCKQARALLGPHAGIMQQFLFHARRMEERHQATGNRH